MPIEIKFAYLRAGTNGLISSKNNNVKQWFVPCNSIIIDVSVDEQSLFDELVLHIPDAYTVREGFLPYSGKKAIPFDSFGRFIHQLSIFLQKNVETVCLRPHDLKFFLQGIVKDGVITQLDANAYTQVLPTTNSIEDKKIQCRHEKNAQLALEIAEAEKQNGKASLIWLIKAKEYESKNRYLVDVRWLANFIADVPLVEFKQLFNEGKLPFWLMQAKANLIVHPHQEEKHINENALDLFSKIYHLLNQSTSGVAYFEQLILLQDQDVEHQLFLSPSVFVTYVEHLENDAFIQLINRGESCYWLIDVLSTSMEKRLLTLSFDELNNEITFKALQRYFIQTKAKLDLKFLPLDDYTKALGISYHAYISVITNFLKSCKTFEVLDISNLKIGDNGLSKLVDDLEAQHLICLKEFIICNCVLTDAVTDILSSLIERCCDIKNIFLHGNNISKIEQNKIEDLLRESSPVEVMRRICSSSSISSVKGGLFGNTINEEESDDLFIEKSGDIILRSINDVLKKLKPAFLFLKSEKYTPLTQLKNGFDQKRSLDNFKLLLEELVDSKLFDKLGLTNSFTVFIENLAMEPDKKHRLLLIIKNQLINISSEKNVNLSQAVFYLETQHNFKSAASTI